LETNVWFESSESGEKVKHPMNVSSEFGKNMRMPMKIIQGGALIY
jgi:hypothetical protein